MLPLIVKHTRELNALCRAHSVLRLELFGSAATGEYDAEQSDLDFLVEFHDLPEGGYADAYFELHKAWQSYLIARLT